MLSKQQVRSQISCTPGKRAARVNNFCTNKVKNMMDFQTIRPLKKSTEPDVTVCFLKISDFVGSMTSLSQDRPTNNYEYYD